MQMYFGLIDNKGDLLEVFSCVNPPQMRIAVEYFIGNPDCTADFTEKPRICEHSE